MSDWLLTDNDNVVMTMYNKKLAEDLGLYGAETLYQMVSEGKWTMDVFTQLVRDASADLTGTGTVDYAEDRFGLTCVNWLHMIMVGGFGEFLVTKDDNDIPFLSCTTERFLRAYQTMVEFMNREGWVAIDGSHNIGSTEVVFASDRALMCIQVLSCVRLYREMDSDFGILPLPKLDEAQENYRVFVGSGLLGIPNNIREPDDAGIIIQAMAEKSYKYLRPAFFDNVLYHKCLRDEESQQILELIFNNRIYDFGFSFDSNRNIAMIIGEVVRRQQSRDYASFYERHADRTQLDFDRVYEATLQ
jgi:ABC-type glycerol-3-phosphate transport system substrate-binding protein